MPSRLDRPGCAVRDLAPAQSRRDARRAAWHDYLRGHAQAARSIERAVDNARAEARPRAAEARSRGDAPRCRSTRSCSQGARTQLCTSKHGGDEGDNDYLDRHVGRTKVNRLAQLQDTHREALVEAIKTCRARTVRDEHVLRKRHEPQRDRGVLKVTESGVCQLHTVIARLRVKLREY